MPILSGEINQVPVTKTRVDFSNFSRLLPPSTSESGHGGGGHNELDEEASTSGGASAPSPQSEAVTNNLQELSLQSGANVQIPFSRPCPNTPPLNERKNVLQLKLQQRRTREELVNQGIMPPLKSPAAFHEQRRSLERARTEDYLKRKIRSRPERAELVRMHILEETSAEPSLQAKQIKLKRARLADDLNEKISQRPGPMELVVKNILPVETSLKEVIIDVDYPEVVDNSSFDEDSSDALSPEQPASQESQGSIPSPIENRPSETTQIPALSPSHAFSCVQFGTDAFNQDSLQSTAKTISNGLTASICKSLPALVKQSQPKPSFEKSQRIKKPKEPKPKVKKLKYHQYIPPDQKQKGTPAMDSSYAKLLQQQQLFLQLQIINQQQHQHYNYQTILPAPPKPLPDQQNTNSSSTTTVRSMSTVAPSTLATPTITRQNSNVAVGGRTGPLPHNLDEMKVAELKLELKHRGLPVSGTKIDLIERLKASQDPSTATAASAKPTPVQQAKPPEVVPIVSSSCLTTREPIKLCSTSSTPPGSPCPSEVSVVSMDEVSMISDALGETVACPVTQQVQQNPAAEKSPPDARDKDLMLREKDRQIEELTQRLKQKQELVERLRQQLEQEKRTPQHSTDDQQALILAVKQEPLPLTVDSINKKASSIVKKELNTAIICQQEPQLLIGPVSSGIEGKVDNSAGTKLVFTLTNPSSQLPEENRQIVLQKVPTPPSSLHPNNSLPKQEVLLSCCALQNQKPALQLVPGTVLSLSPSNLQPMLNMNGFQKWHGEASDSLQKQLVHNESPATPPQQPEPEPPPHSIFLTHSSPQWSKNPPGYDEAMKQQPNSCEDGRPGCLQAVDFFDVLIKNLDIPSEFKDYLVPCLKQTSPSHQAAQMVPQVEMAPPPSPIHSALGRLEDFLESSTGTPLLRGHQDGPSSMPLIDDLHSQMLSSLAILDHPPSPMDTSDLHFSPIGNSLGLDISEPPLDGMDWLELSEPPAMNLTPLSTFTPSVFSTDFLDSHDLHLHWDSCL
ncbi:myocardin-related transcription factor A isoform X4 [Xenopus laevis]|uniref:Myocardin-related transcription factor A isoform X4 n=1 Tax=Xenopus laevis TaxID=8355 RepID=A0A8J0V3J1_XENLA|nr:myocardin-related transcription factor A isoform X4 [Xenopus laevis]